MELIHTQAKADSHKFTESLVAPLDRAVITPTVTTEYKYPSPPQHQQKSWYPTGH